MTDSPSRRSDGRWGEHAEGNISVSAALEEFHDLERELTTRSRRPATRTEIRDKTDKIVSPVPSDDLENGQGDDDDYDHDDDDDDDDNRTAAPDDEEGDFDLPDFLRRGILDQRTPSGGPTKRLGVSFRNMTVKGAQASSASVKTLPRAILNTFGPDLWAFVSSKVPGLRAAVSSPAPTTDLIRDFTGTVREGEIMLVLGRPGSGCSTFLKSIANMRDEYAGGVRGDVYYGSLPADDPAARDQFRGEVVYCEEDDRHFPSLTVGQTLKFALWNKTRRREAWTVPVILDSFLQMFGITHTRDTLVGDAEVRGVSGGERKRVSLAETLATGASVVCWDNSTRGLDASTALSFAKSLRVYTDVSARTTLVTLYQAGESIYQLVDKVLVIDEGRMLFQGPADEAAAYFEDLGYQRPPRQTTADFLTAVSDKNARNFQPGKEESAPKGAEELEHAFRQSPYYQHLLDDVDAYERDSKSQENLKHKTFEATVQQSKSKHVTTTSAYTISYIRQIVASIYRQTWLLYHSRSALYTKLIILLLNSVIVGSIFADINPTSTSSAFSKSGMAFFCIAFIGWLQFAELLPAIIGRATIDRQRSFAFYRPSAVVLARAALDIPLVALMVVVFVIPFYFIARFDVDAGKFFINMLFVYVVTLALTSMYRMFAAFSGTVDDAIRFVSTFLTIMFIFTGYVIPRSALLSDVPWFGWFSYVNPVAFGFEALQANEFTGLTMTCDETQLVPRGPGVQEGYQGCSLPGSDLDGTDVSGAAYIETAFDFMRSNLWRNFGIIIGFIVFFVAINVLAVETVRFAGSSAQSTVFAKARSEKDKEETKAEAEKGQGQDDMFEKIGDGRSVFTFKDVKYTVPYGNGTRRILNGVSGYAKPGKMVALMGSSGAGKTTLLNTLAQRQKVGVVSGEMLVNGAPLGEQFQRGTGFCEQQDIHEGSSTVREALEFSALLRQEYHIPRHEKIAYVDRIMKLLELDELEHALISSLTVEQRKRVTIGVELAAKPSLLLFLDEPTSGLDSQSAFSIVRFLRKLSDAGQAIICTIHQPSSDLIEQFDSILALNPGGNTFYFGPVGRNGSTVVDYFAARGSHCPPGRNVAEFILETAARPSRNADGNKIDWNEEWRESDEARAVDEEIGRLAAEKAAEPEPADEKEGKFASPTWYQTQLLIRRIFVKQWREPEYVYGRLFVHVVIGIINGFTFWDQGNDVASLQNRMFAIAVFPFFMPPAVVNSVLVNFFRHRTLWEDRELPSCTYGWVAFCTSNIVTEIPASVVAGTIYWLLWYFPIGFSTASSDAGYVYLITMVYSLFLASWGQWITAFAPSYGTISNILPFFFVMVAIFNGIVQPYDTMPDFWKYWMYYINPSTWYTRGVMSAVLPPVSVECSPQELAYFDPPPGTTCGEYVSDFVRDVAGAGYVQDENATSECGFCAYTSGSEYMTTLNVQAGDKWPCLGYVIAFAVANWVLVYFFVYTVRIRGWTFGFGPANKAWNAVKERLTAEKKKTSDESGENKA